MTRPSFDQPFDVALFAEPFANPRHDLEHALGTDAARRALAARFILAEVRKKRATSTMHVSSSMTIMPPEPMIGAELGERLVIDRRVEVFLGMQPPDGRPFGRP